MYKNIKIDDELNGIVESGELTEIIIRGAREHNLKGVNLNIPRDKFVVITGLSGSGKSSLAFDTLYAEGQRRYVECLSAYARQFLGVMKKPDVDRIEGLSPAISIEQKTISHNPRSTVGTVTEIYDYLRLLFSKLGKQYCVDCNIPVEQKSLDQIVEDVLKEYHGFRIQILAPIVKGRKGHYRELFEQLIKSGFTRARIDGEIKELTPGMHLNRYSIHNIDLLIDRCEVELAQEHRLNESIELALNRGDGAMVILVSNNENEIFERFYSTLNSCPSCGKAYEQLAPNMFSFNSPYGACPACEGLGEVKDFDMNLIIPDDSLSISEGAIAALGKKREIWLWSLVEAFSQQNKIDLQAPISSLSESQIHDLLFGKEEKEISIKYKFSSGAEKEYKHKYNGILPSLMHQFNTTTSGSVRKNIESFLSSTDCKICSGGRLKKENLSVLIIGKSISEVTKFDIIQSLDFFELLLKSLNERERIIGSLIIKEIADRLGFLRDVGLSYLSLNRSARTLSGGEAQRIRLASQIGSQLVGILYILDEPSIGLHQHDNNKLINSLKNLRDLGNTVIVVEHDKAMIEQSDYVVDIGPGAGLHGGEIILASPPAELNKIENSKLTNSLTAQYILKRKYINYDEMRRDGNALSLVLEGASGNNLQNVTLEIPLGKLICVTGMSGSGKSSLINDTLYPILARHFYRASVHPLPYKRILGIENIDKIIEIDQSPIGRTPRSNPATYTGLFSLIRDFFAMLQESKIRGYKAGRFSFNVPGGRCELCEGAGLQKIEMNFLPDVYVKCEECNGMRYNKETLMVCYKDKNIAEVLDMTVEEAMDFFSEIPKIKKKLQALYDVGLTYITLGQQAPTLSGGEAQRVKLATELSKTSTGKTLYLLDEPTTGLHFEDIRILLKLLNKLVDKGNTVIVIEHNLDVIKCADWLIDMGPEGGSGGGRIIATGTPEDIIKIKKSFTGRYLKEEIKSSSRK